VSLPDIQAWLAPPTEACFTSPRGAATDVSGNIYGRRHFQPRHPQDYSWWRGDHHRRSSRGCRPAPMGTVNLRRAFSSPTGLTVDNTGIIYVADQGKPYHPSDYARGVRVSTVAGVCRASAGNLDGTGSAARFTSPTGITMDSTGKSLRYRCQQTCCERSRRAGFVSNLRGRFQ